MVDNRIAQAAARLTSKMIPSYGDFREVLQPYIERELILARLDELHVLRDIAALHGGTLLSPVGDRTDDLHERLLGIERRIAAIEHP
jgi:hypothetical protein